MSESPSPTPWNVGPHYKTDVYSRDGRVAECQLQTPRGVANAMHIVKCVNAHEALVAALKAVIDPAHESIDGLGVRYSFDARSPLAEQIRAALRLAAR